MRLGKKAERRWTSYYKDPHFPGRQDAAELCVKRTLVRLVGANDPEGELGLVVLGGEDAPEGANGPARIAPGFGKRRG